MSNMQSEPQMKTAHFEATDEEVQELSKRALQDDRALKQRAAEAAAADSAAFQNAVDEQRKPAPEPFMGRAGARESEPAERLLQFFAYAGDAEEQRDITMMYYQLARRIIDKRGPGPERTTALRKLLESRDAVLRAE